MTLDKTMWEHSRSIKGLQKAFPVTEGDGRDGTAKCIAHGKLKMPSTVMCFLLGCFQCIFMYSFIITIMRIAVVIKNTVKRTRYR